MWIRHFPRGQPSDRSDPPAKRKRDDSPGDYGPRGDGKRALRIVTLGYRVSNDPATVDSPLGGSQGEMGASFLS